ncbi:Angiogenic factor with G patch and FHA domains 1 [Chamberlinius hualienensis]
MDEDVQMVPIQTDSEKELAKLRDELAAKEQELQNLKEELNKASDICQKVIKYNEQLKGLLLKKGASITPSRHVGVQVVAEEISLEATNDDWISTSEKSHMSITECVRAAAEEVTRQAGFVYDSSSGYYYDSASGYYYDPEKSLYYDSKSGTFFYYDQETQKYQFHSKVELPKSSPCVTDLNPEEEDKLIKKLIFGERDEDDKKPHNENDDSSASCSKYKDESSASSRHRRRDDPSLESKRRYTSRLDRDEIDNEEWEAELEKYKKSREKHRSSESKRREHKSCRKNDEKYDHCQDDDRERRRRDSKRRNQLSSQSDDDDDDDDVVVVIDGNHSDSSQNRNKMKEEGECSESSENDDCRESSPDSVNSRRRKRRLRTIDEIEELVNSVEDFEDEVSSFLQDSNECDQSSYPPCIRAIVLETNDDALKCGSLICITCQGATIGKEKSCDIKISDILISKMHAEIVYVKPNHCYTVKDLGSVNGTFLNDRLISKTNRHALEHGDTIALGKTKLLIHIHKGNETCDDCEPGQVQAAMAAANPETKVVKILTREEKEKERKRELKQMRKKYGLAEEPYIDKAQLIPLNSGYTDRAEIRRIEKGSDNPYEKTDVASVDVAISQENKGFKMLQKMGWSSGQSLGKSVSGIVEPVQVEGRLSKAGLGLQDESNRPKSRKKANQWLKARERFNLSKQEEPEVEWV